MAIWGKISFCNCDWIGNIVIFGFNNEKVSIVVTFRDRLHRSTILSALGLILCLHGFIFGSLRATSQWVTTPGIAPTPNSLNFGVPMTPKPVSSQKVSC
ncbi:hypothetical protein L3X38_016797 [Prunus dulcis]|uniref:Uncharacterized protein n=1 Tax=Prunus dulcis TaxID=3755 RepID=A0AAD4W6L6_PRUDU|nr:hypothetical protein L3X38_016797 [Prunus dulcis]